MFKSNIQKYISANILAILGYILLKLAIDYINVPPSTEDLIIYPEFPYFVNILLCEFCIIIVMILFGVEFFLRKKYKFNFATKYKLPKCIFILYWIIFTVGFILSFLSLFPIISTFLELYILRFLPSFFSEITAWILIFYIIFLLFKKTA